MFLTKAEMVMQSRKTVECLRNCQKMHSLITALFSSSRKDQNIIYRMHTAQGMVILYIFSDIPVQNEIDGVRVCGQRDLSDWLASFSEGQILRFDLVACPSKKVHSEGQKNSRRRVLRTQGERIAWLDRKAEQGGFSIEQVVEQEQSHDFGTHTKEKGGAMHLDAYRYQGILRVRDATKFQQTISHGIGPEKAYGMGMMMVK